MVVVPSTVTTLYDYAVDVLAIAEDALAQTDAGTPDRAYVTSAPEFAWDCCPFVTVLVARLSEAITQPLTPIEATALRTKFGSVILATYIVTVARCSPGIRDNGFPDPSDIQAVADQTLQDGWALWNGIRQAQQDGNLFDGCLGVHFDQGTPIREQGGCVGWQFQIRASIPGIPDF